MKKYFSKALAMLLVVAMLASQLLVPTFAEGVTECTCDEETRTGVVIDSVPATCGNYGYDVYECDDCVGTYVILTAVPTGDHDYVDHGAQDATCEEIGWNAYRTCNACDYSEYDANIIDALGHDYVAVETPAECEKQGYTTHTCSRCDDSYVDTYTDALEHDWVETGRQEPSNCVTDGYIDYECSVCHGTKQKVIACIGHHDYDKQVIGATCDNAEVVRYTCKVCDFTFDEFVSEPLEHVPGEPVKENEVAPDCVNEGSYDEVVYCDLCDVELSRETKTVPANGHTEGDVVVENEVAPDCVNKGAYDNVVYYTVCGEEVSRETVEIPANGHTEVTVPGYAATCTQTGLTDGTHCTVCDQDVVLQEVIPALGHDYVSTVTDPTCSAQGYTTHVCSRCDDTYVDSYVDPDPLSHRSVVTKEAKAATCTETGLTRELVCGDCGITLATQKTTPIDPDNHNYESVVTDPTCEEKGYTTYTCTRCDHSYVDDEKAALGHSLITVDAQAATCTEIGWDAYEECSVCDYTTYNEHAALGHAYDAVVTDPTCTEQGYTTYTCSRCFDSYVGDYVEATGHNDCETLGVVDPTCLAEGHTVKKCLTCEEVFKDDYVDALGHDMVPYEAQTATCTEIGWDAYEACSRCEETTYVELAALGHDMQTVAAKDATCTEIGWNEHTDCSRCDYTEGYEEIAAKGHDMQVVPAQDSTCTEIGWNEYTDCSRCDYTEGYEEIAAKGHMLTSHDAKDPTCTEIGWDAYEECSECDYTTYVEKPALGHVEIIDEAVAPTYDTTGLTEGKHCDVCSEVLIPQEVVAALNEEITFTYKASGINGSEVAVNSGYITLDVYMNVNSDFARLYGLDFAIDFNENLTLTNVAGKVFDVTANTYIDTANSILKVELGQNMGYNYVDKTFEKGQYLFATLTFKVNSAFTGTADFTIVPGVAARNDDDAYINELIVDFGTYAGINVVMLGDADNNGIIDSVDTMNFAKWYNSAEASEGAYKTVYDLDKDGYVTAYDFALLHNAVVGNDDYLDM